MFHGVGKARRRCGGGGSRVRGEWNAQLSSVGSGALCWALLCSQCRIEKSHYSTIILTKEMSPSFKELWMASQCSQDAGTATSALWQPCMLNGSELDCQQVSKHIFLTYLQVKQ